VIHNLLFKIHHSKNMFLTPGVRLMLIATLGFTVMQTFIKELAHFHVSQIVFFRSGITALLCIGLLFRQGVSVLPNRHLLLFLRTIFGIISMTLFFITVQRIPLGASVSLKYLSLFATALGGVFLLKGFDTRVDTFNFILGVTGAVFAGLVYVIIRKIGNSEHPMVIVNYFMATAAILSGIWMLNHWKPPTNHEWFLLCCIGFFGFFGQTYMTRAFQAEAASRVVPIKYAELIYSLILGFFFFGEGYSVLSFIGIMLILGSMILNLRFK